MSGDEGGKLTADTVFKTLSNPRRRYVLNHLSETEGETTLRELSEQIAAVENDKPVDRLDRKERRRVYTALQQTHLPTMHDAGIVEYDRDRGDVALTQHARDLRIYMEILQGNEIPWSEYYLALAAVSGGVVTAAWLDVFPVWIPDLAYAAIVVGLFAASAAIHVLVMRRRRVTIAGDETSRPDEGLSVDPGTAEPIEDGE